MGDRIETDKECIYCGKLNKGIYFAPTCNSMTFKCEKCKKVNFITTDLEVKKIEDVTYDDIYQAINNASNIMDEKLIKSCAKEYFNSLKKKRIGEIMMAKKKNKWMTHLAAVRKKNPKVKGIGAMAKLAKKTYKP